MINLDEIVFNYLTVIETTLDELLDNPEKSAVVEAMRYSLLGGGKRVRGILTLAACKQVSGSFEQAIFAACAIEMVHCYSLIHDDLPAMDDDDLRRGKLACHIQYGEATALLAGDALLTEAFALLAKLENAEKARRCAAILARAAGRGGMVLGQELDLAAEGHNLTAAQLTRIHSHKTGALINAAVEMGAIIGGGTPEEIAALLEYAELTGLVFQLVDDILDQTADEKALGKRIGRDKKQNKVTGTTLHGADAAMQIAKDLTGKAIAAINGVFFDTQFLSGYAKQLLARNQ